jgi:hypothetical protein
MSPALPTHKQVWLQKITSIKNITIVKGFAVITVKQLYLGYLSN